MNKVFYVVRNAVNDHYGATKFADNLARAYEDGFVIESCGMGGEQCSHGWAILSKPAYDPPKRIDLTEAAHAIVEACKANTDGCMTCPLSRFNQCLVSGGRGCGLPSGWLIAKE